MLKNIRNVILGGGAFFLFVETASAQIACTSDSNCSTGNNCQNGYCMPSSCKDCLVSGVTIACQCPITSSVMLEGVKCWELVDETTWELNDVSNCSGVLKCGGC